MDQRSTAIVVHELVLPTQSGPHLPRLGRLLAVPWRELRGTLYLHTPTHLLWLIFANLRIEGRGVFALLQGLNI